MLPYLDTVRHCHSGTVSSFFCLSHGTCNLACSVVVLNTLMQLRKPYIVMGCTSMEGVKELLWARVLYPSTHTNHDRTGGSVKKKRLHLDGGNPRKGTSSSAPRGRSDKRLSFYACRKEIGSPGLRKEKETDLYLNPSGLWDDSDTAKASEVRDSNVLTAAYWFSFFFFMLLFNLIC